MTTTETCLPAPELADRHLRLKPWRPDDAGDLHQAVRQSVPSVGKWLPWCHANYSHEDAVAWVTQCQAAWRTGDQFAFAIRDASSGELLGGIGLSQPNRPHRSANLGYWVRHSRQRQGIAAAAAMLVARFGFEQLGLIRIEIVILPHNRPSRRTAEKIGARLEAIARQRLWVRDHASDAAVYGLVPGDLCS